MFLKIYLQYIRRKFGVKLKTKLIDIWLKKI